MTKTQKALALLKKHDQLTIALKAQKDAHIKMMDGKFCKFRTKIIADIDDTLNLLKQ